MKPQWEYDNWFDVERGWYPGEYSTYDTDITIDNQTSISYNGSVVSALFFDIIKDINIYTSALSDAASLSFLLHNSDLDLYESIDGNSYVDISNLHSFNVVSDSKINSSIIVGSELNLLCSLSSDIYLLYNLPVLASNDVDSSSESKTNIGLDIYGDLEADSGSLVYSNNNISYIIDLSNIGLVSLESTFSLDNIQNISSFIISESYANTGILNDINLSSDSTVIMLPVITLGNTNDLVNITETDSMTDLLLNYNLLNHSNSDSLIDGRLATTCSSLVGNSGNGLFISNSQISVLHDIVSTVNANTNISLVISNRAGNESESIVLANSDFSIEVESILNYILESIIIDSISLSNATNLDTNNQSDISGYYDLQSYINLLSSCIDTANSFLEIRAESDVSILLDAELSTSLLIEKYLDLEVSQTGSVGVRFETSFLQGIDSSIDVSSLTNSILNSTIDNSVSSQGAWSTQINQDFDSNFANDGNADADSSLSNKLVTALESTLEVSVDQDIVISNSSSINAAVTSISNTNTNLIADTTVGILVDAISNTNVIWDGIFVVSIDGITAEVELPDGRKVVVNIDPRSVEVDDDFRVFNVSPDHRLIQPFRDKHKFEVRFSNRDIVVGREDREYEVLKVDRDFTTERDDMYTVITDDRDSKVLKDNGYIVKDDNREFEEDE